MSTYQQFLSPSAAKNVTSWLSEDVYSDYKSELENMIANEQWRELEDSFFKDIEMGTAGMRGIVGVGSNRLNKATLGKAVQALCEYAKKVDPGAPEKGVVIACDTRLSSPELSEFGANVCAANGFKTYIFDDFRSTPELSFAVRHLQCSVGFVITASHNAPEYNGFKAYWSDGGQLVPPHDRGVLDTADKIQQVHIFDDYQQALDSRLITILGEDVDKAYILAVLNESLSQERDVKIAYSPLHGAGLKNTYPVLVQAGFNVLTVTEQMRPDGHFPTIEDGRANPQAKAANDRVVALMLAENADIAISNDPDADRLGVIVRQNDRPFYLTGNQTAALATDYVLKKLSDLNRIDEKTYIAKTIVTTELLTAIAASYNVECVGNLQVGFKWICELINEREKDGYNFITGNEESFGLMKGTYTRDKDGAIAFILAEYAAELKKHGKTLYDRLFELFSQHGMYAEILSNMTCEGAQGFSDMQKIMQSLREKPVQEIDGHHVTAVLDYSSLTRLDVKTGDTTSLDIIPGNVYVLEFGDSRCRITIRPSGTEPILKFYVQWYDENLKTEAEYDTLMQELDNTIRELEGILLERINT